MRCRPQSMTARRFEAEGSASYPLRERGVDCRGRGSGPVAPRPRLIDGIRPDTNKLLRAVRPPLYREGVAGRTTSGQIQGYTLGSCAEQ
jgi:hypothetical protein